MSHCSKPEVVSYESSGFNSTYSPTFKNDYFGLSKTLRVSYDRGDRCNGFVLSSSQQTTYALVFASVIKSEQSSSVYK